MLMPKDHPQQTENRQEASGTKHKANKGEPSNDLNLAQAIVQGSIPAWHAFIDQYTKLIYSVLHRYVFSEEELRTLYVATLNHLYKEGLASFEGRSALSTWLVLVTRNLALDHVRKSRGRTGTSRSVKKLSSEDQQIFELYFEQGLPMGEVRGKLSQDNGNVPNSEEIAEAIQRIYETVDGRIFRRLTYRKYADSMGLTSSKLLEFLNNTQSEQEAKSLQDNPEFLLMEKEAGRRASKILQLIKELNDDEQRLLSLRYGKNLSAKEVAEEMAIADYRRVYRMVDGVINKVRKLAKIRRLDL